MHKENKFKQFSYSRNLRNIGKINDQFELMITNISLEELIALKLELSARSLKGKFYGFPIWKASFHIIKSALIKFAISSACSQKEAANILGISLSELRKSMKKYKIGPDHD